MKASIFPLALSLLLSAWPAFAVTKTWTGGGADDHWNNPTNWNPSGAPANGDDIVFPAGAVTTSNNNLSGRTFASLTFNAGATVQGNTFTVTGGITSAPAGTGAVVIEPDVTLGGSQTFTSAGGVLSSLRFAGNVTFGAHVLTIAGARALAFEGLTGSANAASRLLRTGSGLVRFGPAAIFISSAPFTWSGGVLDVDGIFQAPLTLTGGTLAGAGTLGLGLDASGGVIIPDEDDLSVSGDTVLRGTVALRVELIGPSNEHALECTGSVVTIQEQATLEFAANTYVPVRGDTFLVLRKSTASAITGAFSNAAEGADFADGTSLVRASYTGGSGNDLVLSAIAVTRTWDGGAVLNDNWNDATNWANNIAPLAGDILVFPTGIDGTDRGLDNNFANNTTFRQLVFNGDDFTVRGNPFRLTHGLTLAENVQANIDTDFALAADQTFTFDNGSTLHLDLLDSIDTLGRTLTLQSAAGSEGIVDGRIRGSGGVRIAADSTITFQASNDYDGPTVIEADAQLGVDNSVLSEGLIEGRLGSPAAGTEVFGTLYVENSQLGSNFQHSEPITLREGGELYLQSGNSTSDIELSGIINLDGAGRRSVHIQSTTEVTFSGRLTGTGGMLLTASDSAVLLLKGPQDNIFGGGLETTGGTLILDKADAGTVAVPGPDLVITGENTFVETRQNEQIADACHVRLSDGGTLRLGNTIARTETIRHLTMQSSNQETCFLSGDSGSKLVLTGDLTVLPGTVPFPHTVNPVAVSFAGTPSILDVADVFAGGVDLNFLEDVRVTREGGGSVRKTGLGAVRWYQATVPVEIVQGDVNFVGDGSGSPVTLNGGIVSGDASCGSITAAGGGGRIEPGQLSGTAVLSCGGLILNGAVALEVEVQNFNTGTGCDQLSVSGTVSLGGAALDVQYLTGFDVALGQSIFPLLNNGTDAIVGTFAGLPQGAFLPIPAANGGGGWTISYTGGTGNDVALTRVAEPPVSIAPEITGFTLGNADQNGNRPVNVTGRGTPGVSHQLETSTDLKIWTPEGAPQTAAPATGALTFTATASPSVRPIQFWRVRQP